MTFHRVKIWKIRKIRRKIEKIWKTWSITKKRKKVIRHFGRENEIFFLKTVIQKSWSAKFLYVPPNSAPGLRLWNNINRVCIEDKYRVNKESQRPSAMESDRLKQTDRQRQTETDRQTYRKLLTRQQSRRRHAMEALHLQVVHKCCLVIMLSSCQLSCSFRTIIKIIYRAPP